MVKKSKRKRSVKRAKATKPPVKSETRMSPEEYIRWKDALRERIKNRWKG